MTRGAKLVVDFPFQIRLAICSKSCMLHMRILLWICGRVSNTLAPILIQQTDDWSKTYICNRSRKKASISEPSGGKVSQLPASMYTLARQIPDLDSGSSCSLQCAAQYAPVRWQQDIILEWVQRCMEGLQGQTALLVNFNRSATTAILNRKNGAEFYG